MKQLITYSFLLIAVSIHAQTDTVHPLQGTWYISMVGASLNDTTIYRVPKGKSAISFGDQLEQTVASSRFYIRAPQPLYIRYENHSSDHKGTILLYQTKKERRKRREPIIVEYLAEKDRLMLIEQESAGISTAGGFYAFDKLTLLTKTYDSLQWNKHILGGWNYTNPSKLFFDLQTGDTCRFTKAGIQEDNQFRFDLNSGSATCKIKENPAKPTVQSNGILDGVYLRDSWFSFRYAIDLSKRELTFLGNFGMSFRIVELTNDSLVLVKQVFQLPSE